MAKNWTKERFRLPHPRTQSKFQTTVLSQGQQVAGRSPVASWWSPASSLWDKVVQQECVRCRLKPVKSNHGRSSGSESSRTDAVTLHTEASGGAAQISLIVLSEGQYSEGPGEDT